MFNSPEIQQAMRDGFAEGEELAKWGPKGPPLTNPDGTRNPEAIRIFLEETRPLVDRLRPAAWMFYLDEEDEGDDGSI